MFVNAILTAVTVIYRKTLALLIVLLRGVSLMFDGSIYIMVLGWGRAITAMMRFRVGNLDEYEFTPILFDFRLYLQQSLVLSFSFSCNWHKKSKH